MLGSILDSLQVISLPTKTNFRGVTQREVALFFGPIGWAEFSPFLEYGPEESVPWLVSAVESAYVAPPAPLRKVIEINATLPAVNDEAQVTEVLSWYPGCKTIKVKVGENFAADLQRITLVKKLAPEARIRLDVNGAWTVDQATAFLLQLHRDIGEIEYVEQPCATLEELWALRKALPTEILIAGDEIIRKSDDPLGVNLVGAVDLLVLKVAPLGGIKRCQGIASHFDLPVVVSSALESAIGISYGLKLAATLPTLPYANGLGTGALLSADVATLAIRAGEIEVGTVSPSIDSLAKYAVDAERLAWWRERIRQTWLAGAGSWVEREGWLN